MSIVFFRLAFVNSDTLDMSNAFHLIACLLFLIYFYCSTDIVIFLHYSFCVGASLPSNFNWLNWFPSLVCWKHVWGNLRRSWRGVWKTFFVFVSLVKYFAICLSCVLFISLGFSVYIFLPLIFTTCWFRQIVRPLFLIIAYSFPLIYLHGSSDLFSSFIIVLVLVFHTDFLFFRKLLS